MAAAIDGERDLLSGGDQGFVLDSFPCGILDAVERHDAVARFDPGLVCCSVNVGHANYWGRHRRNAVDQGSRERDRQGQHDIHERPAQHHEELLPAGTEFVKLGIRDLFVPRGAALKSGGLLVAVEFHIGTEGDRGDTVIGMPDLEAPNTGPEAEERISLNPHAKPLGHDEMAELVDVDRDAENEYDCENY